MSRNLWYALIVILLLCVGQLSSLQQSSAADSSNQLRRATRSESPESNTSNTPPNKTLPASPAPSKGNSKDVCDPLVESAKFDAAKDEFDDLHLDSAASLFLALTASCNEMTQRNAIERLAATHKEMSKWWWQMGRHFAPFRWYHIHYPRFWWAVLIAFLIAVLALVPIIILFAILYAPQFTFVRQFKARFANSYPSLAQFLPTSGPQQPIIMTPNKLTKDVDENLFASKLQSSALEARRVLQRAGAGLQVRSVTLLSLPSNTANELISSLPKVKGVDVSGLAKFAFYLVRYLNWRVESEVGFCPPSKSADGTVLAPGRIVASASVRSAWMLKAGPWPVDRLVDDQYDIDAAAFAIAVRIMGSNRGQF